MTTHGLEPGTYRVLSYDYVSDILQRRDPYREDHLAHAKAAKQRGELLNVGAVGSPPTGALFVFHGEIPTDQIESYANADPYVPAGLVSGFRVEEWNVVV